MTPCVNVPVLSNTTVSTVRATSSTRGSRRTIPRPAPRPDATSKATGVAKPSAHGHAMTKTVMAIEIDRVNEWSVKYQPRKVAIEIRVTIGTKTELIRSARRCIGAFEPCALMTIAVMRASSVSLPILVARTINRPL